VALSGANFSVVDSLAACVTKSGLVSFPRFMPRTRTLVLAPALVLAAAASSVFLFAQAPIVRAQCGSDASAPACPTPINAFLSLDVTQGDSNTVINVTGGQFLPNEQVSLYWDASNKVAGSATADAGGSFNTRIKPFAGDAAGTHKLCASVPPSPCANFVLVATASPSPSPSPTASESPSASAIATVTETPSSSPVAATLNGFDVISRPPFVFLPIAGAAAIGLALVFWAFSVMRRPRTLAMPSAAVVHRASRPDYGAAFGMAPAATPPAPEPSAWPEGPRPEPPPPQPAAEESQASSAEWGPPVEWGTGSSDWGFPEPPDQGEDNLPEPPQPGD
jgi:hypothetical protein